MREPVKIVVNGMIDPALVLSAVAHIERRNAEMIDEGGVIAAGAESADAQISAGARILLFFSSSLHQAAGLGAFPHGDIFLRVVDVMRDIVDELLQRMRALNFKEAAPIAVRIDIDGGVAAQLV